jgi:predicted RNA binding protein YcfA (HicA-like mRNA interferase family)
MSLPSLRPREIESAIERDGWFFARQKGSHRHYKHAEKPGLVTIPFHARDVYPILLRSIIKQAGLTEEEFRSLL